MLALPQPEWGGGGRAAPGAGGPEGSEGWCPVGLLTSISAQGFSPDQPLVVALEPPLALKKRLPVSQVGPRP